MKQKEGGWASDNARVANKDFRNAYFDLWTLFSGRSVQAVYLRLFVRGH